MLQLIVLRFWPAFIPLLLYVLWMHLRRRKARKAGEEIPRFLDGPWLWAVIVSLFLVLAGFFALGISHQSDARHHYVPKQFENGELIDETLR